VLLITSRDTLSLPISQFELNIGCGSQFNRHYRLLPLAPGAATPAEIAPALGNATATPSPSAELVVDQPTTLRLISRRRYPGNAGARVRFIQRTAAVNPQLFHSSQTAFDQPLTVGTRLQLPPTRSAAVGARPRLLPKVPPAARERLVIGHSDSLPPPTAAELDARMSRLIDIMNEQLLVQISMIERINQLESDIAAAKHLGTTQAALNQKLEQDVRQLKDEQAQQSIIQLVLAILLGGFAGAAFLLWRDRAARPTPKVEQPLAAMLVLPPYKAPAQRIQSVFDDLLPPK
jgi:hypothetical protein